jgi:hypothetical protein
MVIFDDKIERFGLLDLQVTFIAGAWEANQKRTLLPGIQTSGKFSARWLACQSFAATFRLNRLPWSH